LKAARERVEKANEEAKGNGDDSEYSSDDGGLRDMVPFFPATHVSYIENILCVLSPRSTRKCLEAAAGAATMALGGKPTIIAAAIAPATMRKSSKAL
jgi:hypothetical protein